MQAVERYLSELHGIHSSGAGVAETSFYPALSNLLNEVGKALNPKVRCIIHPANVGAGLPDGGLFTADQLRRTPDEDAFTAQVPSRGAIEVKPPSEEVDAIAGTAQLARYLDRYRQVLVTNLRDFALFGREADGQTVNSSTVRWRPTKSCSGRTPCTRAPSRCGKARASSSPSDASCCTPHRSRHRKT